MSLIEFSHTQHDKEKVLKFSFYDDEDPKFNLVEERLRIKQCDELLGELNDPDVLFSAPPV